MTQKLPDPALAQLAAAKKMLANLAGCALLIGVETYDGLPADKQLLAGRNDVLSYWKVCRRLGYKPEHIRVLTSPRLTPDDILRAERDLAAELHAHQSEAQLEQLVGGWFSGEKPAVVLGEATREALIDSVKWLAATLVFTVKVEWEGVKLEKELAALPGLFAYSGHGARVEGDLALCPRDVGSALERAVSFSELRALVDAGDDIRAEGTPRPADNLTVVLDCCFASASQGGSKAFRVPTLTRSEDGGTPVTRAEIGSRVFCASGRDEQAYQAMLGGRWQGAFTWAFTRALEQWKTAPSGRFKKSTVSHIELLFRARMLLEALSVPQHPVLLDQLGNLPVFQHDSDATDDTSADPDKERKPVQLDPTGSFNFTEFTLSKVINGTPTPIAVAIIPNGTQGTWDGNTEYWYLWQQLLTSSGTGWTLRVDGRSTPSQASGNCFQITRRADWTGPSGNQAMDLQYSGATGFSFGLTASFGMDGKGTITWFNHTGVNVIFGGTSGLPLGTPLSLSPGSHSGIFTAGNTIT